MARMDFPSTNEGFTEFKRFVEQYKGTNKMKLIIISDHEAVLRSRLATRYDAAYIKNLNGQQIKELEQLTSGNIEVWHVDHFYWDEEVKDRKME